MGSGAFWLRLSCSALIAGGAAYLIVGRSGALAVAFSPLGMPDSFEDPSGAVLARVDPSAWSQACVAADLPQIPDPTGIEFEPIRRVVEASARWTRHDDGDALGRIGEILLALEQHEAAIDFFSAACELGTQRARWRYLLGCECQAAGRPEAAVAAFVRAAEIEPGYGLTHTRLGQTLSHLGQQEEARAAYKRGALLAPGASLALTGLARLALADDDATAALRHIDQALATAQNDYIAVQLRAQILMKLGRNQEALLQQARAGTMAAYRGWLSFDPRLQEAHATASTYHSHENAFSFALAQGDSEKACAEAEILAQRRPRDADALRRSAAVLANAGKLELARKRIKQALELDPDELAVLCTGVEIALADADLPDAVSLAERAVRVAPSSALALQMLARARYFQGRPTDAVALAQRAVELEPLDVDHMRVLVEILRQYQRTDEAERALREFLARVPGNPWALKELQSAAAGK